MKPKLLVTVFSFIFLNTAHADINFERKALVYRGDGACPSCSVSAAERAKALGIAVEYIGPKDWRDNLFGDIDLWIQPGGQSYDVSRAMDPRMRAAIKEFVQQGGAYVGFCAGALFSTEFIKEKKLPGVGLFPGTSQSYRRLGENVEAAILSIHWIDQLYKLYWEGGNYFEKESFAPEGIEVVARYESGEATSLRRELGEGRAYVTGLHPEAPQDWREAFNLVDPDGLDFDLAEEMILWTLEGV